MQLKDASSLLWCSSKQFRLPLHSDILLDSKRLCDLKVAIDDVRQVWKDHAKVRLGLRPLVCAEIVRLFFIRHLAVVQYVASAVSTMATSTIPVAESHLLL